jgi:hypothetical protein
MDAAGRATFDSWLTGFAVVTFDLELGPTIEMVYPPDIPLTKSELTNGQATAAVASPGPPAARY